MLRFFEKFSILILILFTSAQVGGAEMNNIDKIRQSIVTIEARVPVAAYNGTGSWSGTGFLVDGVKGYIITNRHVVGRASVGTYFVTFHNGQQAEAKLLFADEYVDFAVLKISPSDLPKEYNIIEFSDEKPKLGADVFVVGNTEGQGFSFHTGHLADLYEISGEMPQGSYIINLNSAGGSSGSPILDAKNKAIGVLYGGGQTHVLAFKAEYVQAALKFLKNDTTPKRQHIGVMTKLYSLDKAVKHSNFSKEKMEKYIIDFPDARNRVVIASELLSGSPAEGIIEANDILWKVNGQMIGADLHILDVALDKADKTIKLTIIREGVEIDKEISVYSLELHQVSKMLEFAGGLFFQVDDYFSHISGAKMGSVALANVQTGSSFSSIAESFTQNNKNLYRLQVQKIHGKEINNLSDVSSLIKEAVEQKYVTMKYLNKLPYYTSFGRELVSAHEEKIQDITFDAIDNKPRYIEYSPTRLEWISKEL